MKLPFTTIVLSTLILLTLSLGILAPEVRALGPNPLSNTLALTNNQQSLDVNPKITNPESFTAADSKKAFIFQLLLRAVPIVIIGLLLILLLMKIKMKKSYRSKKDTKKK